MKILICQLLVVLVLSGCASYGNISNQHLSSNDGAADYSVRQAVRLDNSKDLTFVLAFSGGGTRAAALSYGVLQALRETMVKIDGKTRRLLDEIDVISSVSGGSFTAAYYGLFGDRTFSHYEEEFLRRNVAGELLYGLINPALWFSRKGRTEMAINYYERTVFKGSTYADLQRNGGPVIVINASDLGRGIRFSFVQDYFDLLCSDLASFPVSRAVTASSAVPIMFNPVVLKNYPDCDLKSPLNGIQAKDSVRPSPQIRAVLEKLSSYSKKKERQYIHLVDGGITDNLGLLAIHEMVEISGGAKLFLQSINAETASKIVVISVNASTSPRYTMELSNEVPTIEETINAMSDTQLHSANAKTLELMGDSMIRWSEELSSAQHKVEPYFIEVGFNGINHPARRLFFNQIPVSFSLNKLQVDRLIEAGRNLLLTNPEFRRLIRHFEEN